MLIYYTRSEDIQGDIKRDKQHLQKQHWMIINTTAYTCETQPFQFALIRPPFSTLKAQHRIENLLRKGSMLRENICECTIIYHVSPEKLSSNIGNNIQGWRQYYMNPSLPLYFQCASVSGPHAGHHYKIK